MARREVCFLEKGSLAGKLASKKSDIVIAQALSKLRECIDVLKNLFFRVPGRCHKLYLLIKVSSVLCLSLTDAFRFLLHYEMPNSSFYIQSILSY